jgi:alkanesulfonate monooxygenase SsuD/methylene tetrahydromethanopterin reductase-like flavin-dependent oxidoreductase (luciferase family)
MHCGVMVTGYNQGDWERLLAEDYSRPPAVSDATNMDDTLYLGELVEPLGFDSIWATEHYGSAYSMQPNPLQYLAYWAGRTTRVDVGTAVIVAPWWNPVRLASEISMLDILLKGRRLHLGIGRGISPHEYASLGYPIGESHAYFYDVIGALKAADGAERFTFDGKVYKIPPTTIRPQARHKGDLTTRIKAAFTTEASARLAAENGLGQMFVAGASLDEMTAQVRRFNMIRAEIGMPPDQPTTLLWMYCAETALEAEETPRRPAPLLRVEQPGLRGHSGLRGVPQALDRRRRCGRRGPRGAPRHPADRYSRRDHREDQDAPARHQPRDGGHPHVLRGDAPSQGGEEPPAVRGEGPSGRAGHANPDSLGQPKR